MRMITLLDQMSSRNQRTKTTNSCCVYIPRLFPKIDPNQNGKADKTGYIEVSLQSEARSREWNPCFEVYLICRPISPPLSPLKSPGQGRFDWYSHG